MFRAPMLGECSVLNEGAVDNLCVSRLFGPVRRWGTA